MGAIVLILGVIGVGAVIAASVVFAVMRGRRNSGRGPAGPGTYPQNMGYPPQQPFPQPAQRPYPPTPYQGYPNPPGQPPQQPPYQGQ
ncbi:hypothetical protein ABIE67_006755 [Streptomyces sp. V4I8]